MKGKKDKGKEMDEVKDTKGPEDIASRAELKAFLTGIRDRVGKDVPPVYAMSALNHVLCKQEIYDLMDAACRELLQEIWVQLSQNGFQIHRPPILFGDGEAIVVK